MISAKPADGLAARFFSRQAALLERFENGVAVIALDLDDAVFERAARAAQPLEVGEAPAQFFIRQGAPVTRVTVLPLRSLDSRRTRAMPSPRGCGGFLQMHSAIGCPHCG